MHNTCFMLFVISVICASGFGNRSFHVLEKLKTGMRMAKNFLSFDHASKVANLVSEALEKTNTRQGEQQKRPNNIFSGFLRLFGFDSKKIGAIAVNAIIIVAQLISSSISLKPPSQLVKYKTVENETPFDWMINNKEVSDLLTSAKDKTLPDMVIQYIQERSLDEDSGCVQLLICKTTPFILKMQEAVSSTKTISGSNVLYEYLPTADAIADHGDDCEKKHPYCTVSL